MNSFVHSYTSAQENLAFEQWFFEHFKTDSLRLWVNPSSVIIGKHQSILAEANVDYCLQHHIPILRRISGGGTVYHDLGNINFSFFRKVDAQDPINYVRNLLIIQHALNAIGYPVEMNHRHDLVLDGFKISGNAQHVKKDRALHHGTILYDTDIETLRKAIKRTTGVVEHRAVKSVRSKSKNLRDYKDLGDVRSFHQALQQALNTQQLVSQSELAPTDSELHSLIENRYNLASWNFGYGPKCLLKNSLEWKGRMFDFEIAVARGGTIERAELSETSSESLSDFFGSLPGKTHFPETVKEVLVQKNLEGLKIGSFF